MKLLVTGNLGLIGTAICKYHLDMGDTVVGFDNKSNPYIDYKDIPGVQQIYESQLKDVIKSVDAVSIQGSFVSMVESQTEIAKYMNNNVNHVANILQAILDSGKKPKIILGSSMGFYEHTDKLIKETDPLKAHSFYGISKQCQEDMVRLFSELYGVDAIALRYFTVHGVDLSMDNPKTGVINWMHNQMLNNWKISINGDGKQTRDIIDVRDVAEAHYLAINSDIKGFEAINIGRGVSFSLIDIANDLVRNTNCTVETTKLERKGDIYKSQADIRKAKRLLGHWVIQPGPEVEDDKGEIIEGEPIHVFVPWQPTIGIGQMLDEYSITVFAKKLKEKMEKLNDQMDQETRSLPSGA